MPGTVTGKYVSATIQQHGGRKGILLKIQNPDSKVNTVALEALEELHRALDEVEKDSSVGFVVLYGNPGKVHAGADLTLFAGDINFKLVQEYLLLGAKLDFKIKTISERKRTVSIMQGERYGGSVEWPLMTRFSVCTPDTAIQFSEVNIGIIPGWAGILNVLLRSNRENALYLTATGDRVAAQTMLECGLVTCVAEGDILKSALDLATRDEVPVDQNARRTILKASAELERILAERADSRKYRDLKDAVSRKIQKGELSEDKTRDNYAGRYINEILNDMGKPAAPLAVTAIKDLLEKFPDVSRDNLDPMQEMGELEAKSCLRLMHTQDRETGVNSVLTKISIEKIPVYVGR